MDTEVTLEDAIDVAKKSLLIDNLEVNRFNLQPFSTEIKGYLSEQKLLTIDVTVKSIPEVNKTLTFFVKSTHNEFFKKLFRDESKFYNDVVPQMLNNTISEPFLAQSYLARDNVIVLENLKPQGYKVVKTLSLDHLKAALTALARYHASSLIIEKKFEKPLSEVYTGFFRPKVFTNDSALAWQYLSAGIKLAEAIGKNLNLNTSSVYTAYELALEKMKPVEGRINVLNHNDLWAHNFMFYDTKDEIKCKLVDFQSIAYKPYLVDLLQLIYLSTPEDIRPRFEKELLEFYHKELTKVLRENNYSSDKLISLEKIFNDAEESRVCGLVIAVQYFPTTLLNDELSEEFRRNREIFEKFSFDVRNDFVLMAMQKDKDYQKRLEVIVKELIDYMEKR